MCVVCQKKNNKYVIDDNVYQLSDVILNDKADDDECVRINKNFKRVLILTSVRVKDSTVETPGYVLHDPTLKGEPKSKGKTGKATKVDKVDGRAMISFHEVTDPQIVKIMRTLLVQHSDKYADSKMKITHDGKNRYRVLLTGVGSHYCLNKCGYHRQNHVYMELVKTGCWSSCKSWMRCWSRNPVVYRTSERTCKDYDSVPKPVFRDATANLFPSIGTETAKKMNYEARADAWVAALEKQKEDRAKRVKTNEETRS
jgi:hypothetical protein